MYTMDDIKDKINEKGKVRVIFYDDIDDIEYIEYLSPAEALYELNNNSDAMI